MAIEVSSLMATLGLDQSSFDSGVSGATSKFEGLGNKLASVGTVAVGGLAVVATGVAAIGATAFNSANDISNATNQMQASLGITAGEANNLQGEMLDLFGRAGLVGSIEEAGVAIAETQKQISSASPDQLDELAASALAISNTFDEDMGASLNSANALIENFGLSGQQSFDLITSGFQQGLNNSGDFLDSVGEYSNVFADAGFSAEDMFNILDSGAKSGVLGTDKIADAVKEFGINMASGGDDTIAAFDSIGLSFDDIQAQVSSGQASFGDFFDEIVGGINSIEDPIARQQAQVGIFGTMAEDLGANFTEGLSTAGAAMSDFEGATASLDAQFNTIPNRIEGMKRSVTTSLAPLGEILIGGLEAALPTIESAIANVTSSIEPLTSAFSSLLELDIQGFTSGLSEGLATLGFPTPLADAFALSVGNLLDKIVGFGEGIVEFSTLAGPMINDFISNMQAKWEQAGPVVQDALDRMDTALAGIAESFGLSGEGIDLMSVALGALEGVLDAALVGIELGAVLMQGIAGALEAINDAINISLGLWNQLGAIVEGVGDQIPDWLKPGSPPPLFFALRDINRAISDMPSLTNAFGTSNLPTNAPLPVNTGQITAVNDTANTNVLPATINFIIDGRMLATMVSNLIAGQVIDFQAGGGEPNL